MSGSDELEIQERPPSGKVRRRPFGFSDRMPHRSARDWPALPFGVKVPPIQFLARHWRLLTLGLIFGVALAVRAIDVVDNPRGFFTDEASFGLNAHLILTTAQDEHGKFLPLLFRSFGEYKLPVFIYAEVPFVAILGRTELAVRLTAAVLGSLSVVTLYLLGREIFRRELPAFAAAACLAILPWHIHYSRTGLGDIVALPLVFALAWYLFLRAVRDERFFIPAAIALGAVFYTYRGGWVVMPPLLLIMVVVYRHEIFRFRRKALQAAIVFGVMMLPIVSHLVLGSGDRSSQAWIFNLDREQGTLSLFWDFYTSYFSNSFLFQDGDNGAIVRHYLPGQGVLYLFQLPLIILGFAALVMRLNRRYLFVLALVVLFPLSGALSDTSPISSRTILGAVTASLLSGAGLWMISATLAAGLRPWGYRVSAAVVAIVAVVALASFGSYISRYHSDYPATSAGYWGWQDGPEEIIDYFLVVRDGYDQMYMDGKFNAPRIFFQFYAGGQCDKCFIGGLDRYDPAQRQLFALRPENLRADEYEYTVLDTLIYPDGELAFVFIEIITRR